MTFLYKFTKEEKDIFKNYQGILHYIDTLDFFTIFNSNNVFIFPSDLEDYKKGYLCTVIIN